MMNKRIRSMIDDIFSEMKMSAENLALRDELMANAQARYEDSVAAGKSEEEAFREVADSLEDVQSLLEDMNGMDERREEKEKAAAVREETVIELKLETNDEPAQEADEAPAQEADEASAQEADVEAAQPEENQENKEVKKPAEFDLGDTLNKAFSALGEFGQSLMPQAKKIVREADKATGGAIAGLGRAVNRGMQDAQKAAGEAIDKLSGKAGELTFDFGGKPAKPKGEKTAQELRDQAGDLKAEADLKLAVGDEDGARELQAQAAALETQADALEQAEAIEQARAAAQAEADAQQPVNPDVIILGDGQSDEAPAQEEPLPEREIYGADGEINEDAFAKTISDLAGEAERLAGEAKKMAEDTIGQLTGSAGKRTVTGGLSFPVAGLRSVNVKLDADDVVITPVDGFEIVVDWDMKAGENETNVDPECTMINHELTVRRRNPDVFKTFFSVFKKSGGEIRIGVPRGFAADYTISTTSGDIRLRDVDADVLKVSTTSGDVRLEPEASARAKEIGVNTVSGDVAVSACVDAVAVTTVSGDQFISCDACSVDVNVVSGSVHVEGACESFEVDSVSGDVDLLCTVAPTRKIDVNTMSADVRVALPGDVRGFLADISGVSGSIVNEFGPNRYGTCALPIHMDTVSGQLLITRL